MTQKTAATLALLLLATPAVARTQAPAQPYDLVASRNVGEQAGVGASLLPLGLGVAGVALAQESHSTSDWSAVNALARGVTTLYTMAGLATAIGGGILWGMAAQAPERRRDARTEAAYDAGFTEGLGDGLFASGALVTGFAGLGLAIMYPHHDSAWAMGAGAGIAAMGTGGVLIWRGRAAADALTPVAPTATLVNMRF